jgi:hypothetical protein
LHFDSGLLLNIIFEQNILFNLLSMENFNPPKSSTVFKFGLYYGIVLIVLNLIVSYGGLIGSKGVSWVSILVPVIIILLGLRYFKEKINKGMLKYGQGVGLGVLIALIGGCIVAIFSFIFLTYIDPEVLDMMIAVTQEQVIARGIPEEMIDIYEKVMNFLLQPWVIALSSVFNAVFIGLIVSLIEAAILKKEPQVI